MRPFGRLRGLIFLAAAMVPLYWLWLALTASLGPDPGKELVDRLGQGTLVMLLLCLSMTPLRRLTDWSGWMACRRQLGLWSACYGTLHATAYMAFLLGWEFARLATEIAERPYILVGLAVLLGMVPLVATSTRAARRRLGSRWLRLHRGVYLLLALALLHMLWVVRSDLGLWALYAAVGAGLLLMRLPPVARTLQRAPGLMGRFIKKGC